MLTVHQIVHDNGVECLDYKMYESFSTSEDGLLLHTRIFRDPAGHLTQRILYRAEENTGAGALQRGGNAGQDKTVTA